MAYSKKIIDMLNSKCQQSNNTTPRRRVQRESGLQIQCVRWFQLQYPAFSRLLYHAKNESASASRRVAIEAAAGVVPGVPDLILALPAKPASPHAIEVNGVIYQTVIQYTSLGIELKYGKTNNQSTAQREFQAFYEAAGNKYLVIRSLDEFITAVNDYMAHVPEEILAKVRKVYHSDANTDANKKRLQSIINQ